MQLRWGGVEEDGLRFYLMEELQPLCEAEPSVLADYVIALLKNEAPISELQINCERELVDFLQEHTKLFAALEDRSYLKSYTPSCSTVTANLDSSSTDLRSPRRPDLAEHSDENGGLEWEGWGRQEAEHRQDSKHPKRRRSRSHSSDEEREHGRGGQRSLRRRERTPSPPAIDDRSKGSRSNRSSEQSRQASNMNTSRGVSHSNELTMLGPATARIQVQESEEYNPEDPIVPELRNRNVLRNLIPTMPGAPIQAPNMHGHHHPNHIHPPPPHPHPYTQSVPNPGMAPPLSGGVFSGHFLPGNVRLPPPVIKSPAEMQMFLRAQIQNQLRMKAQMNGRGMGMPMPNPMGNMGCMPGNMGGPPMSGMGAPGGMGPNGMGVGGNGVMGNGHGMAMAYGRNFMSNPMGMNPMMHRGGMMGMVMNGFNPSPGGNRSAVEFWERDQLDRISRDGQDRRARGDSENRRRGEDHEFRGREQPDKKGRGEGSDVKVRGDGAEGRSGHRAEVFQDWKTMSDTINVTNVPEDKCTDRELRGHFSKFGRVIRISVDVRSDDKHNKSARVTFSSHAEARAAISSVTAVMGNRFIQVKWAAPLDTSASIEPVKNVPSTGKVGGRLDLEAAKEGRTSVQTVESSAHRTSATLNPSARLHQRPDHGGDMDAGSTQAVDSADAILQQQKKIMEQLRDKSLSAEKRAELKAEFKRLKDKLTQALETAARSGGADRSSPHVCAADVRDTRAGRGTAASRVVVMAGAGGPGGSLKLDNRPRKLLVSDMHEDIRFPGLIKCHFETFGSVEHVAMLPDDPSSCTVEFLRRRDAEMAMSATVLNGKTLSISWYSAPTCAPAAAGTNTDL